MARTRRARTTLLGAAVLVTALVVVLAGIGWIEPNTDGGWHSAAALVGAALLNSIFIYTAFRTTGDHAPRRMTRMTRDQRVNVEFRHEMERFLVDMGGGPRRKYVPPKEEELSRRPAPPIDKKRRPAPPGDALHRLTENLEILGGYREDLAALLRLYQSLQDETLSSEEKKKIRSEIVRFEKVIALPFLIEDSASVQEEARVLLDDLRMGLEAKGLPPGPSEEWTPVELGSLVEQVIRSLPEDRVRPAYIQRHLGDVPLVLTRPNTLFEAVYHMFDLFLELAGGGKTIHFRTAQRGEDAWIGIGVGPLPPGTRIATDARLSTAEDLWKELGGSVTVGDGEVQILLPMHGPTSIFSSHAGESAEEKTS